METNIIKELIGKLFKKIENINNEELIFKGEQGSYVFYHNQDCCEEVVIEIIDGDLNDLRDSPITMAEETIKEGNSGWGSKTWTFYKFATVKGYVTVKWIGESNGYYSESVDFRKI